MSNKCVWPLPNGFPPGSRAIIKGIPNADVTDKLFGVVFSTELWNKKEHSIFCFDFYCDEGYLMTCKERHQGLPIVAGKLFEIVIICEATHLSLYIDGNHFRDFQHRTSHKTIQYLKVVESVKVISVTVDRIKLLNWPLRNGFKAGDTVAIRGVLGTDTSSDEFQILFQNSLSKEKPADIPLSITIQFKEGKMINNTYESKMWGKREIHQNLPLELGKEFEIAISNRDTFFRVFIGDENFWNYNMRISYDNIRCLIIRDNVNVSSIALTSAKIDPRKDDL